jgi:hypothetical protein
MVLFLIASALFALASMYVSQVAPLLFAAPERVQEVSSRHDLPEPVPVAMSGGALKISLSDADEATGFQPYTDEARKDDNARPGDSVLPNAQSCPAAGTPALTQPLGTPSARERNGRRPPVQNGAAIGTGSGCPPTAADAGQPPKDLPAKPEPQSNTTSEIARSGGLSGPANNP